jgi:glycosyltransferase involved in cell wall biosynthesis
VSTTLTLCLRPAPDGGAPAIDRWIAELAGCGLAGRLVTDPGVATDDVVRTADGLGVELVTGVAPETVADEVVVFAGAGDAPGAGLLSRLAAETGRGGRPPVVSARNLPVEPDPHHRRVRCCAITRSALPDEVDIAALPDPATVVASLQGAAGDEDVEALLPSAVLLEDVVVTWDGSADTVGLERRPPGSLPSIAEAPPSGHPAALSTTSVGSLVSDLGLGAPEPDRTDRPFLTVITRTQGRRIQCLSEVLDCLSLQTVRDFELVLACHRIDAEARERVEAVVAAAPAWLRERVTLLRVERPGRSSPLNDALDVAAGRYAVVLDDDDTVFPDWVETFARLEQGTPGAVLRAVAVRQDTAWVEVDSRGETLGCPVGTGAAAADWPARFRLVDHLHANYSPCMTVAFPRGFFADLGQRYDESLDVTEDWHFLVRAAALVGVASSPRVTSVYRWWVETHSSREAHDETVWTAGRAAVLSYLDRGLTLLPAGEVWRLDEIHQEVDELWQEVGNSVNASKFLNDRLVETLAAHDRMVSDLRESIGRLGRAESRLRREEEGHRAQLAALERVVSLGGPPDGTSAADLFAMPLRDLQSLADSLGPHDAHEETP